MTNTLIKQYGWSQNEVVTSNQLNQLQQFAANSVDKTGETVGTGGGVSGEIDILSGASLNFLSGSTLTFASGSGVNGNINFLNSVISPTISQASIAGNAQNLNIIAGSSSSGTGGNLALQSGTGTTASGAIDLLCGNQAILKGGTTFTNLYGGNEINFFITNSIVAAQLTNVAFNVNNPFFFGINTAAAIQQYITAANPNKMTFAAQSTTNSLYTGAELVLSSGVGPRGGGEVVVQTGGTGTPYSAVVASDSQIKFMVNTSGFNPITIQSYQYTNPPNTQLGISYLTPVFLTSSSGVSSKVLPAFFIANGTTLSLDVSWIRRDQSGGTNAHSGRGVCRATADNAGNVNAYTSTLTDNGIGFDSFGTAFYIVTSGVFNNLVLWTQPQSTSQDWQIRIIIDQC